MKLRERLGGWGTALQEKFQHSGIGAWRKGKKGVLEGILISRQGSTNTQRAVCVSNYHY